MADFEDESAYAEYSTFNIGDSSAKYVLTIDGYSGTAGDSMTNDFDPHSANGKKFSTKDSDNDTWDAGSCSENRAGARWYGHCGYANLNSTAPLTCNVTNTRKLHACASSPTRDTPYYYHAH